MTDKTNSAAELRECLLEVKKEIEKAWAACQYDEPDRAANCIERALDLIADRTGPPVS